MLHRGALHTLHFWVLVDSLHHKVHVEGGIIRCSAMGDGAFVTQGLSASVARKAGFSVGDTLASRGGDAVFRISRALHGLVTSLVNSLEEFRDVEVTLDQETVAGIVDGSPGEAAGEALLIAGILKEMVGLWVSDIKANVEIQKLLPAMQKASGEKHHALFQDLMTRKDPSCAVNSLPAVSGMPVCISSKYSKLGKRAAGKGEGLCKHFCDHHPEVVDPELWRNLPQELVERVFAKLPLPCIVELRERSKAWYTMSKSSNFGEACSERHPKLFGLLGWSSDGEDEMWSTLYDMETKEWLSIPLAGLPGSATYGNWELHREADDDTLYAYRTSVCACDGGLACFVPQNGLIPRPILVCNPLTSVWKALPLTPLEDFTNKLIITVELVMEDDRKGYRVIVVSREKEGGTLLAHYYKSETGLWSIMDAGLVYGVSGSLEFGHGVPYAFDCTTGTVFDLRHCASLQSIDVVDISVAQDRVYVLRESVVETDHMFLVSEHTWDSSTADLRQLNVFESPVEEFPDPYKYKLYASRDFVLFFVDIGDEEGEDHHEFIGLYNVSANQWDVPPWPANERNLWGKLQRSFMCELRWDITP